jgi:anti-sigma factor RsiW
MNCSDVHKHLVEYLEGELSEENKKMLEKHMDNCTSCYKMLSLFRKAWHELKNETIPYQPFFYTRLKEKMEQKQVYASSVFPRLKQVIIQPAIYLVVLALGIYIGIQLGQGIEPQYASTTQSEQTNYIELYAKSQYLNGMELEVIEQEMLTNDTGKNTDYE